jgi:putative ABC transport system permease protein
VTPAEIWRRLRFWKGRDALDDELSAELGEHLALLARDAEHAGLSHDDALAAARRRLGNITRIREESRDSWGFRTIESVLQDLRHALRALRRAPGFTVAVIVTLGLGMGATSAIFSVVNGVLLRPLPFPHEDRLITLCEQYPGATSDWCSISPPNIEDIAARSHTIEAIGIGRGWSAKLTTPDGPKPVQSGIASPGLFAALGVGVVRGRLIAAADLLGRESDVALLTWEMWQEKFSGDTGVIGRMISLDNHPVRIVGILEPGFHVPQFENIELWRPLHVDPRDEQHRDWRGFVAYGRLKPGVSQAQARAELASVTATIRREHFATTRGWDLTERSLRDLVVGNVRPLLVLFLAAVAVVLLIACANVSNLLLARGAVRDREMAARSALGASRGRIVRALLVESLVLAAAGAAVGIAIALGAVRAFRALAPAGTPRIANVAVDARVFAFAAVLAMLTALVVGLVPALRAARVDLAQALREGGGSGPARRSRLGSALVAGELAMAVLLIAGAATFMRSFAAFTAWKPGFERDHLALFSLSPPTANYDSPAKLAALWDRLEAQLGAIPGVASVGTASAGALFGGRETWEMELQGRSPQDKVSVRWFDVSPGFFSTLGVPLLKGRALDAHDVDGSRLVCLVNATLVRRYWPGLDPIGRTIVFPPAGKERTTFTVVGVVADVPSVSPGVAVEPEMYWSNRQGPRPYTWVVVRTTTAPASLATAIRGRVKEVDRDISMSAVSTMPERLSRELNTPRFEMILLQSFGLVALVLAAVGTYGLLAYLVTMRRREIGIRLAIGAQRVRIVSDVLSRGLRLAGIGIVAGLLAFLALGRWIASLAPGVSMHDPLTLSATALVLLAVATAACALPAVRAGQVDPALTLGAE